MSERLGLSVQRLGGRPETGMKIKKLRNQGIRKLRNQEIKKLENQKIKKLGNQKIRKLGNQKIREIRELGFASSKQLILSVTS